MTTPLMPQLRALLDRAEPFALVYASSPNGAVTYIQLLDDIDALVAACSAAGLDIEAERVRVVALDGRAIRDAEGIIRALGDTPLPAPSVYAPRLAALAQSRRSQRRRRRSIIAAVVLFVAVLFTIVIVTTPPSADTLGITNAAVTGDIPGAYSLAQTESQRFPDDPEVLLWLSVLAEAQGDRAAAQRYWEACVAQTTLPAALAYQRGNTRLLAKNYPAALQSVDELLAAPATVPEGLFLRAGVYESQGDVPRAIADYEAASRAAEAANRQELVALSRIRMGGLMQFGAKPTFTPVP